MDSTQYLTVVWKLEVFCHLLRRCTACSVSIVPYKLDDAFLLWLHFTLLLVGSCNMYDCDLLVHRLD